MITTQQAYLRLRKAGIPATPMTVRRWFYAGRLEGSQAGPGSPIMIEEASVDRVIRQARNLKEP